MEDYIKLTINKYDEGLMALLSLYPYESFEEVGDSMVTYIKAKAFDQEVKLATQEYLDMFDANFELETIAPQNWNEVWESNFSPVEVDDFCRVRADFHDSKLDDFDFELTIHPKMAFGTGHHETTYMMIQQMRYIDFHQKSVFDYGCGSGILAILADLCGAQGVFAVDIEVPSYESTIENSEKNGADQVVAACGDISAVPHDAKYDIILANINRNVLLESVDALVKHSSKGGLLLLSGILEEDEDIILDAYEFAGYELEEVVQRGKWICIKLRLHD